MLINALKLPTQFWGETADFLKVNKLHMHVKFLINHVATTAEDSEANKNNKTVQTCVSQKCFLWLHSGSVVSLACPEKEHEIMTIEYDDENHAAIAPLITSIANMCRTRICTQIGHIFFVFFRRCPECVGKDGSIRTWSADDAVMICVDLTKVNEAMKFYSSVNAIFSCACVVFHIQGPNEKYWIEHWLCLV